VIYNFTERDLMAIKSIRTRGERQSSIELPESSIKVAAYYLWEKEGRPTGEDLRHWYLAIAELSSNVISSQPTRLTKQTKITKISSVRPKRK
jgi:Protein of unknown function (DUF2934)